jgi:hypothetical protein
MEAAYMHSPFSAAILRRMTGTFPVAEEVPLIAANVVSSAIFEAQEHYRATTRRDLHV